MPERPEFDVEVMLGGSVHATVALGFAGGLPDWDSVVLPPLPGPALPPGQPAPIGTGGIRHYGYTLLNG